LADEIERWLADEPVSAWREPLKTRVRRWGLRHRVLVTAMPLLVLQGVLTLYLVSLGQALDSRWRALDSRENVLDSRENTVAELAQALGSDYGELRRNLSQVMQLGSRLRGDLEQIEVSSDVDSKSCVVANMLLFLVRPTSARADFLRKRLLKAGPEEVDLIATALAYHPEHAGVLDLDGVLGNSDATLSARLRAACALARLAPVGVARPEWDADADWMSYQAAVAVAHARRPAWDAVAPDIVRAILAEDRRTFGRWLELLDPVARRLLPALARACRDEALDAATHALAAEAAAVALARSTDPKHDPARELARLAVGVPPEALPPLARELARRRDLGPFVGARVAAILEAVLAEDEDAEPCREVQAHRQANAALTLLILGMPDRLWPLLRHRDDPRPRALLIGRLAGPEVAPGALLDRLRARPADAAERQALLMALAEVGPGRLAGRTRAEVFERAEALELAAALHRADPDPGVHAAAGLLLRRRGEHGRLAPRREALEPRPSIGWYDGPNGHTFAVLRRPGAFLMGTPEGDPWYNRTEPRHVRRIDRSLAVATTETTRAQFLKFDPGHAGRQDETYGSQQPDGPAGNVSWYQAARYCNWLSARAGLPRDQWCYPEPVEPGMVVPADAIDRAGYRLPTEAEWEYACRAGTTTPRPFGQSDELLPRHAWTYISAGEQAHPVARLLPNRFGLFDMLGNVWEWCHDGPPADHGDAYEPDYPPGTAEHPAADRPGEQVLKAGSYRLARGGAFDVAPSMARSARRYALEARLGQPHEGFRVVRTLLP
jgi:formylglycine-generating enzyme required for sulfatase activity